MRLQAYGGRPALRRNAQHSLDRTPEAADRSAAGRSRRLWRIAPPVVLLAALLSGCGLMTESEPQPPCPGLVVLDQARTLTLYREGAGRDLTDVAFEASLLRAVPSCEYDLDDEGGGGVTMTFTFAVEAARGPGAETDRVSLPYFVAIVDPSRQIVAKEVFTVELVFAEGAARSRIGQSIEQHIPLAGGATGAAYETYIGFQLTRSQMEDALRRDAR